MDYFVFISIQLLPGPMHSTPTSSFDQEMMQNDSPSPVILCATTTTQHDDGRKEIFPSMSDVSSSNMSFRPPMDSFNKTMLAANIGAVYNQLPADAVQFGLFVAQRLTKMPNERMRQKLENCIQATILNIERECFD